MRSRRSGWLLTLALVATPGVAQQTLKLEYRMAPGQVLKYRSWIRMASINEMPRAPQPARMQLEANVLYQQTVQEAAGDTFTYETEILSGQTLVRVGDQERQQEVPTSRERTVISRRGEVQQKTELDEQGNPKEEKEEEPVSDPLEITDRVLEHAVLAERPVKPGDRWEHTADIQIGSDQTVSVPLRFQWKRWVRLMGRRCAEIEISFSLPLQVSRSQERAGSVEANGQLTGVFMLYFDPDQGIDVLQVGRVESGLVTRFAPTEELQQQMGRELPNFETKFRAVYHLKAALVED